MVMHGVWYIGFKCITDERTHFYLIYCGYVGGLAEHANMHLIFCSAFCKNLVFDPPISQFLYAILVWTGYGNTQLCDRLLLWIQLTQKNPQSSWIGKMFRTTRY